MAASEQMGKAWPARVCVAAGLHVAHRDVRACSRELDRGRLSGRAFRTPAGGDVCGSRIPALGFRRWPRDAALHAADGRPDRRGLNSMSARLKSSDEQRRSFLADVVHELRTPLSVIRGQAEGIADGVYEGDAPHIAPIVDATRSLEVLVEDLRALALTDTGSLALNREPVDPAELVDETVATFAAQADEAGVKLVASAPSGLPVVDVDPTRMRSAIGNVIANAIRHTPSGGSVSVLALAAAEGDRVVITVTDTGEGIAPDLLPHVFERFVRGAGSTGSGLGLAIAHDITVAHGGTIDVDSTAGTGTTLRMSLPIAST
ncbi:MAG: HAMP domain-containing histidine kinase [Chloroflexi bacterium]|nr:MAG: HAMP domain-containing histidine kinase [Chloroflexota bacterium]